MTSGIPLGPYLLGRRLAVGGMAEIFLARREVGGEARELVVKRILPHLAQDPQFSQMFFEEARIVSHLNHPNVVRFFDFGEAEGSFYLAMELVRGVDLGDLIARAARRRTMRGEHYALPPAHVATILASVCEGLSHAHALVVDGEHVGLVHRDITPANVLLGFDGSVKVADFGVAKLARGSRRDATRVGRVRGKYAYLSPEQSRGESLDARSDLFNVGILLFEAILGEDLYPHDDKDKARLLAAAGRIPNPERIDQIPEQLARVVRWALAPRRQDRAGNALELRDALRAYLEASGIQPGSLDLGAEIRAHFPDRLADDARSPQAAGTGPHAALPTAPLTEPVTGRPLTPALDFSSGQVPVLQGLPAPAPRPRIASQPPAPRPRIASQPPAPRPRIASRPPAPRPRTAARPPAPRPRIASRPPQAPPRATSGYPPSPSRSGPELPPDSAAPTQVMPRRRPPKPTPRRGKKRAIGLAALAVGAFGIAAVIFGASEDGPPDSPPRPMGPPPSVVAESAPRPIELRLRAEPAGLSLRVDGRDVGPAPQLVNASPDELHQVEALRDGEVVAHRRVRAGAGEVREIVLRAPVEEASVRVVSTPPGARASVDGQDAGITPITLTLSPGSHHLELVAVGFGRLATDLHAEAGQAGTVAFALAAQPTEPVLSRAQRARQGRLTVTLRRRHGRHRLRDARVHIDGGAEHSLPLRGMRLSPGVHQLELTARGRSPRHRRFRIRRRRVTRLRL